MMNALQTFNEGTPETYTKNLALANLVVKSDLTLRRQKAWHLLMYTVREKFFAQSGIEPSNAHHLTQDHIGNEFHRYEVDADLMMTTMGYEKNKGFYSYTTIRDIFKSLSSVVIGTDALNIATKAGDKNNMPSYATLIAQIEVKDGNFVFLIPPLTVLYIVNPPISFSSPLDWSVFTNKFAPIIYDLCAYFYQHTDAIDISGKRYTDYFSISEFRKATSTMTSTYDNYDKLKKRVILKALDNINDDTTGLPLEIALDEASFQESKIGRNKITHVRFIIRERFNRVIQRPFALQKISERFLIDNLEPLGVPPSSIRAVVESASDQADPDLEYLRWCIKKGQSFRELRKYAPKTDDSEDGTAKVMNFGGFFHKHIVKENKEAWFATQQMIHAYINKHRIINLDGDSKLASKIRKHCLQAIAVSWVESLNEFTLEHFRVDFINYVKQQLPHRESEIGQNPLLSELANRADQSFMLYLDDARKLFDSEQFALALEKLSPDSLFRS